MHHTLGINIQKVTDEQIVRNLSRWNLLTAPMRVLPDFLVAGVQKGGTTSLVQYLTTHPELIQPQRKDVFYFNNLTRYRKGNGFYRAFFCLRAQKKLLGLLRGTTMRTFDGTPNYFDAPGAAQRIHKSLPGTKVVLLLRNPVKRAYSNYNMAVKFGFETLPFYEALQVEDQRVEWFEKSEYNKGHNFVYQRLAYRKRGEYSTFLPEWMEVFGDRLYVDFTEHLDADPQGTYNRILDFLKLKTHEPVFEKFNKGEYKSPMDEQSRSYLESHYKPYNISLQKLLNQTLPW